MASQKVESAETTRALRSPLYQEILRAHLTQGVQRHFDKIKPDIALRNGRDEVVNCGDGGTHGYVRLPVTLYPTDKLLEFVRVARVSAIHRHRDCGAEKLCALHHGVGEDHAIEFIDAWYAEVSRLTRMPIGQTAITRPEGFHPEPIVVYDGLGINPALLPGAPLCYHVSRLYYTDREGAHDASSHCGTYTDIMFGPAGLADRLNASTPGVILVVGNPRGGLPYEKLKEELQGINAHRAGRLIVTGFNYHPK